MDLKSEEFLNNLPDELAMNTKVWGPPTWFFLHSVAMAYPKKIDITNEIHIELKQKMYSFLSSLGYVLPCSLCGESYSEYITRKDYLIWKHLDSRRDLSYLIYKIHNLVNEKLGVLPCNIPSFYDVLQFYARFVAGNSDVKTIVENKNTDKVCKNTGFKQYKCIVNVLDTKENITEIPKEKFNNLNYSENFINLNNFTTLNLDFVHIILIIIIILILIYFLYFKKK